MPFEPSCTRLLHCQERARQHTNQQAGQVQAVALATTTRRRTDEYERDEHISRSNITRSVRQVQVRPHGRPGSRSRRRTSLRNSKAALANAMLREVVSVVVGDAWAALSVEATNPVTLEAVVGSARKLRAFLRAVAALFFTAEWRVSMHRGTQKQEQEQRNILDDAEVLADRVKADLLGALAFADTTLVFNPDNKLTRGIRGPQRWTGSATRSVVWKYQKLLNRTGRSAPSGSGLPCWATVSQVQVWAADFRRRYSQAALRAAGSYGLYVAPPDIVHACAAKDPAFRLRFSDVGRAGELVPGRAGPGGPGPHYQVATFLFGAAAEQPLSVSHFTQRLARLEREEVKNRAAVPGLVGSSPTSTCSGTASRRLPGPPGRSRRSRSPQPRKRSTEVPQVLHHLAGKVLNTFAQLRVESYVQSEWSELSWTENLSPGERVKAARKVEENLGGLLQAYLGDENASGFLDEKKIMYGLIYLDRVLDKYRCDLTGDDDDEDSRGSTSSRDPHDEADRLREEEDIDIKGIVAKSDARIKKELEARGAAYAAAQRELGEEEVMREVGGLHAPGEAAAHEGAAAASRLQTARQGLGRGDFYTEDGLDDDGAASDISSSAAASHSEKHGTLATVRFRQLVTDWSRAFPQRERSGATRWTEVLVDGVPRTTTTSSTARDEPAPPGNTHDHADRDHAAKMKNMAGSLGFLLLPPGSRVVEPGRTAAFEADEQVEGNHGEQDVETTSTRLMREGLNHPTGGAGAVARRPAPSADYSARLLLDVRRQLLGLHPSRAPAGLEVEQELHAETLRDRKKPQSAGEEFGIGILLHPELEVALLALSLAFLPLDERGRIRQTPLASSASSATTSTSAARSFWKHVFLFDADEDLARAQKWMLRKMDRLSLRSFSTLRSPVEEGVALVAPVAVSDHEYTAYEALFRESPFPRIGMRERELDAQEV
ncbi:unnamed protein product [Amoebophrya sp. A120]|nr:unnamed protein product [Amoebophrya sp. A120]|eukprot:GSA120T00023102001.1